jgi:hypothetical protein
MEGRNERKEGGREEKQGPSLCHLCCDRYSTHSDKYSLKLPEG